MNAHLLRTNQQRMHEAAMNIGNTTTQVHASLGIEPTANTLVAFADFEEIGTVTFEVAFEIDPADPREGLPAVVRFEQPHVVSVTTEDVTREPLPAERVNLESMVTDHIDRHHEQYEERALAAAQD